MATQQQQQQQENKKTDASSSKNNNNNNNTNNPIKSFPSTLNVTSWHMTKSADGKEAFLGRLKVTSTIAHTYCRIVSSSRHHPDSVDHKDLVTLHDGTSHYTWSISQLVQQHGADRAALKKVGSVVKLFFHILICNEPPYNNAVLPSFYKIQPVIILGHDGSEVTAGEGAEWNENGVSWRQLLQQHWVDCKQYYYKHCSTIQDNTHPEFNTPYHFIPILANQMGLIHFRKDETLQKQTHPHLNKLPAKFFYEGVDITHRLLLNVDYVSRIDACNANPQCHPLCRVAVLGESPYTKTQIHMHPKIASTPPQIDVTMSTLTMLSIGERGAASINMITQMSTTRDDAMITAHAQHALAFATALRNRRKVFPTTLNVAYHMMQQSSCRQQVMFGRFCATDHLGYILCRVVDVQWDQDDPNKCCYFKVDDATATLVYTQLDGVEGKDVPKVGSFCKLFFTLNPSQTHSVRPALDFARIQVVHQPTAAAKMGQDKIHDELFEHWKQADMFWEKNGETPGQERSAHEVFAFTSKHLAEMRQKRIMLRESEEKEKQLVETDRVFFDFHGYNMRYHLVSIVALVKQHGKCDNNPVCHPQCKIAKLSDGAGLFSCHFSPGGFYFNSTLPPIGAVIRTIQVIELDPASPTKIQAPRFLNQLSPTPIPTALSVNEQHSNMFRLKLLQHKQPKQQDVPRQKPAADRFDTDQLTGAIFKKMMENPAINAVEMFTSPQFNPLTFLDQYGVLDEMADGSTKNMILNYKNKTNNMSKMSTQNKGYSKTQQQQSPFAKKKQLTKEEEEEQKKLKQQQQRINKLNTLQHRVVLKDELLVKRKKSLEDKKNKIDQQIATLKQRDDKFKQYQTKLEEINAKIAIVDTSLTQLSSTITTRQKQQQQKQQQDGNEQCLSMMSPKAKNKLYDDNAIKLKQQKKQLHVLKEQLHHRAPAATSQQQIAVLEKLIAKEREVMAQQVIPQYMQRLDAIKQDHHNVIQQLHREQQYKRQVGQLQRYQQVQQQQKPQQQQSKQKQQQSIQKQQEQPQFPNNKYENSLYMKKREAHALERHIQFEFSQEVKQMKVQSKKDRIAANKAKRLQKQLKALQKKSKPLSHKRLRILITTNPVRIVENMKKGDKNIFNWSEKQLKSIEVLADFCLPTMTPHLREKYYTPFITITEHYRQCQQALASSLEQFENFIYTNHHAFVAPTLTNLAQHNANIQTIVYQLLTFSVNKINALQEAKYPLIGDRVYQLPQYRFFQQIYEASLKLHQDVASPAPQ